MEGVACQNLAKALSRYHTLFSLACSNTLRASEVDWFADILLGRLILIYDLQVAGFLAKGDRWYLHTQLGQYDPRHPKTFFKGFLQPLCHQGLGLPPQERPRSLQQLIGDVPYLGAPAFQPHWLEQRYPDLDIPDEPIEQFLGWLAEQDWQRPQEPNHPSSEAITPTSLSAAFEFLLTERMGKAKISTPAQLKTVSQATLDAYLLKAIGQEHSPEADAVETLRTTMTDAVCRSLVTTILPNCTILDPACRSGRLLVMALEKWQAIYQICWQYAQTSSDSGLQNWVRSLNAAPSPPQWSWTRQIVTQNLYGVDLHPEAVHITQWQLWLRLLVTAQTVNDLSPLPDLDFNIASGNALVGFIRVDTESFDKISPKRPKQNPSSETILQGNLLQPLTAANYRDTLAAKKIRVEHYQAQTVAMGADGGIPEYARTEFLRDRIETVNQTVQERLDGLLFETFSHKLGIQVKEPHISGKTRRRPVTREDIAALKPFHWGFVFSAVIEQQGGFDIILTDGFDGTLRPRSDEFYRQHVALMQKYRIGQAEFRRSRRRILQSFPEIDQAWAAYAGHIACLRDYVRRSDDYQFSMATAAQRSISLKTLFLQRCLALIKADGIPPHIQ
jgi:hypothetical protein